MYYDTRSSTIDKRVKDRHLAPGKRQCGLRNRYFFPVSANVQVFE